MKNFERNRKLILANLKISETDFLGKGVESVVYSYGASQVIRILKESHKPYLESLQKLQALIAHSGLVVRTPLITDVGEVKGTTYTIEKRLEGQSLAKIFTTYTPGEKDAVIKEYFTMLEELAKVDVGNFEFGQMVETADKITASDWQTFLLKKVKQKTEMVRGELEKDVPGLAGKLKIFTELTVAKLGGVEKRLVHGDYFYDNVMANSAAKITGILDFSGWTTVVGDFRLDACGAIVFLEHSEKFAGYQKLLTEVAKERYGTEIEWFIDFYRIYYCLFLADSYLYLKPLYYWCVKNLNDEERWRRLAV